MDLELKGKVALVTGAGSGIGRACAIAFAREGAKVALADVVEENGESAAEEIRAQGGDAQFFHVDVGDRASVSRLFEDVVARFGGLDCACNNAGIGGPLAPTGEYPEEAWDRVLAINLTGAWLCMKHEIPLLLARGGGSIVNMASILGRVGFANAPAYTAAKHGLIGVTRSAALEYAQQNIRVNAVCPGFIATPLIAEGMPEGSEALRATVALHPVGRLGTSEEVAGAVLWLCSGSASFVTGEALVVDGGYLTR